MAQAVFKRGPGPTYVTLLNNSGATITVGDLVEDDLSNGVKALTNGGNFLGVAHETILTGATGVIELPNGDIYQVDLATGFNPSYLDPIFAAGSGTFDAGTGHAAALAAGYIVDTDPASGGLARAIMYSKFVLTAAHG